MLDRDAMTLYLIIFTAVFALGVFGIPAMWSSPKKGSLTRDVTSAINGYFIGIVFLSHLRKYIDKAAFTQLDQGFLAVIGFLGQLVVTTFLLYSGYGIMESIIHKGEVYVRQLPKRRILPFLMDVWLALLLFLATRVLLGKRLPSLTTLLFAMVGWKSIGNSNWYIFAILCLWIITYVSFRLIPHEEHRWVALLLAYALTMSYCWLMRRIDAPKYFYDTVLCYPSGMALSYVLNHPRKSGFVNKHPRLWWAAGTIALLWLFLMLRARAGSRALVFNVSAIVFALLVTMVALVATHTSKPFVWAGQNLFYLYIYQRIPMLLLQRWLSTNTILYTGVCLVATIALCMIMLPVHKWLREHVLQLL